MSNSALRFLFRHAGKAYPNLFARWGVYLWGRTYRPPWRRWEETLLQSAKREFLPMEKENIALYHWGAGPQSILLLPGWNSRASHFRSYIQALTQAGYRVLACDPIGHGHSSGHWTNIRQYLALIACINEKHGPFHAVIGHSFGGFCIPYAIHQYKIAHKAVLLSAPGQLQWLFERLAHSLHAPPAVRDKMQQRIETLLGKDCWQKYSVSEYAPQLGHIPAMIVHDEKDPGVPFQQSQENQALWPNSQLLRTQKLGHHRTLRHPATVRAVVDFIQKGDRYD